MNNLICCLTLNIVLLFSNSYGTSMPVKSIKMSGVEKSKLYEVEVGGVPLFVGSELCYGNRTFETTMCEASNNVTIVIRHHNNIQKYRIRPLSKDIQGVINGCELNFKVDKPQMLLIEINDSNPLLICILPREDKIPKLGDKKILYYGPGIHEVGIIRPKSGETIYLAAGALVKGYIYAENVKDVQVKGRGILDARGYTNKPNKICGIEFKNSRNIKLEGIGLRTGEWWQTLFLLCNHVEVSWMNLLSFGLNNDGVDIDGVTDFYVHNCFIGCGDDGFGWHAVDAASNGEPPTINCLAENCVIYNTYAGNGLRVGASMETQLFKNITFRNIDVLEHKNAAIRSDHSDWAICENITFENFFIENEGHPIEIKIEKTRYSNNTGFRDSRGQINGLNFINVQSPGGSIILSGFDNEHAIRGVTFENCCINGPVTREAIKANEFVYELIIRNDKHICLYNNDAKK